MNEKKKYCPVCFKMQTDGGQWIDCDIDPLEQSPDLMTMLTCPACVDAKENRRGITIQLHPKLWGQLRDLQTIGKIKSIHSTMIMLLWRFIRKGKDS